MSYQITLNIAEDSEIGRLIESMAAREQLSREEAALKLSQGSRNGAEHSSADEAEQTAQGKKMAAIARFTGCLKSEEDTRATDWWWQHFNEEHYADIERENQRDLI